MSKRKREEEEEENLCEHTKRKEEEVVPQRSVITFYPTTETKLDVKIKTAIAVINTETAYPQPTTNKSFGIEYKDLAVCQDGSIQTTEKSHMIFYQFSFHLADLLRMTSVSKIHESSEIVECGDMRQYLQKYLPTCGLTEKEVIDFITFWHPLLLREGWEKIAVYRVPQETYDKLITLDTDGFVQNRVFILFYQWFKDNDRVVPLEFKTPLPITEAHVNECSGMILYDNILSPRIRVVCATCKNKFPADEMELVNDKLVCDQCIDDEEEEGEDEEYLVFT